MGNQTDLKLQKWPFLIGDAVLVGFAGFIAWQNKPLGHWEIALALVSCVAGALLLITPWYLEFQAAVRLGEAGTLASATEPLKNLEALAAQIGAATAQWQMVQELSGKTVGAAKNISDQMTAEAAAFTEFAQKANDAEKAGLRLEVEKMRRAETDWLQVSVRLLDHTYALHQAGLRSGQRSLIEQLGNFQNACRDVARRIGLVPFTPGANEPFNPQLHQLADADAKPQPGAKIDAVVATGFTFQGRPLRPAIVTLQADKPAAAPSTAKEMPDDLAEKQEPTLL